MPPVNSRIMLDDILVNRGSNNLLYDFLLNVSKSKAISCSESSLIQELICLFNLIILFAAFYLYSFFHFIENLMLLNISYLERTQKVIRVTFVSSILVLFFSAQSSAQLRDKLNLPDSDEKTFHIGIVLMGTSNRFQLSQHPNFLQHDSVLVTSPQNSMGLGLGGMFTLRISKRFELRTIFPQLLFVNKSISYTLKYPDPAYDETAIMTKNVESILLGLPLQVKFRSDRINNFRVYMMGGGKLEYDLSSKARAKNAEDLVKLQPFDYGIEAGVGFNFYMPYFILSPEIKISNGIGNSHSRDPNLKFSNVIDKLQTRMIVFSLIFEG